MVFIPKGCIPKGCFFLFLFFFISKGHYSKDFKPKGYYIPNFGTKTLRDKIFGLMTLQVKTFRNKNLSEKNSELQPFGISTCTRHQISNTTSVSIFVMFPPNMNSALRIPLSRQWAHWTPPPQGSSKIRRRLDVESWGIKISGLVNLNLFHFWTWWIFT